MLDAVYELDRACTSADRQVVEEAACALEGQCWRPEWQDRCEASRPDGQETQWKWVAAESRVPPRRPGRLGRPMLERVRPVIAEVADWLRPRHGGEVPWSVMARGCCALGWGRQVGKLAHALLEGNRRWRSRQDPDVLGVEKNLGSRK